MANEITIKKEVLKADRIIGLEPGDDGIRVRIHAHDSAKEALERIPVNRGFRVDYSKRPPLSPEMQEMADRINAHIEKVMWEGLRNGGK